MTAVKTPLLEERKFVADTDRQDLALAWLQHACVADKTFPRATVFSIYYDTPRLTSYYEKSNGDFLKTKASE